MTVVVSSRRAIAAGAALLTLAMLAACTSAREAAPPAPVTLTEASAERATATPVAAAAPDNRLIIGRGEDYQPINEPPDKLFEEMRDSMQRRRQRAWQIVENIVRPATLAAGGGKLKLPVWQTWYENRPQVLEMMTNYFEKLRATPGADREQLIEEVFQEYTERDLAERLTDATFQQMLKQFEGSPELTAGLNGRGFTLFSPSFVKHMMLEAQGTETCSIMIPASSLPEKLPPPASATNFSSCIREFPRSAVMVKTQWTPIDEGLSDHDTGEQAMRSVIRHGTWPVAPTVTPAPASVYTLTSESGERMALTAIHLVTKDIREWVWVTLWWDPQPDTDFGADRPASLKQYENGVWANYKMCTTGSFEEGDVEPWAHFSDPSLQGSVRAVHSELDALITRTSKTWPKEWKALPRLAKRTTWCSNPNVEQHVGNGRTNCIGCHQYPNTFNDRRHQRTRFDDTLAEDDFLSDFPQDGRARFRENFPADFSWAFGFEYQGLIRAARRAASFEWPQPNPSPTTAGARR